MKSISIVLISLITLGSLSSQTKSFVSYSPGGANEVHGIMFNVFPNVKEERNCTIIKGLELEISPASLLVFAMTWSYALLDDHSWRYDSIQLEILKEIEGVHLGIVNLEPSKVDGLELNILNLNNNCRGVSIAGFNIANQIEGVSVGVIRNYADKCDGVQIGLFNETEELNGFQFGLWNKNQKRSLPFINWNFSSRD